MTITYVKAITLDDVRTALGDTDPARTNAGALRTLLGRGSMATIQKHLDAIRLERTPALPAAPGSTPAAPPDAVAVIWSAAWAQAQLVSLGRMELLAAERDAALALVAAQAQDVAGLTAEIDAQTDAAQTAAEAHTQALTAALAQALAATTQAAAQAQELDTIKAEIEQLTAAAAQAQVMALREAQIERQTMQAALERQIDKYTDLKSIVDHLKPMAG